MELQLNLQLFIASMIGTGTLVYGIPKIWNWRITWPSERYTIYLLTLLGVIFFIWSLFA